jgi:hypothetical protein
MENEPEPECIDLQSLSLRDYDQLMKSLNRILDQLWSEIQQDPEYTEFFDNDDEGPGL